MINTVKKSHSLKQKHMSPYIIRLKNNFHANPRRALIILVITVTGSLFTTASVAYGILGGKIENPFSSSAPNSSNIIDGRELANDDGLALSSNDSNGSNSNGDNNATPGEASPVSGGESISKPGVTPPKKTGSSTPSGSKSPGRTPANPSGAAVISLRNIIPQYGRVLTLNGLNYNVTNYVPNAFGGIFNRSPYLLSKVSYPASLASDSISTGVVNLNTALRSTPGQKIVLAHSQGAQVASHWMRQYANDPTAPGPSELTFILFGNPLRSTGGYIIGRHEVGGTIGQPTPRNTKWPIIDVARRYDGWADWVQDSNNQWAVDNAIAGRRSLHPKYEQVDIYSATNTVWQSGNTTYVLTKEDNLPLWDNNSEYPLGVLSAMRAYIERAYSRPSNDPRTIILSIESEAWKNQLRSWGVPF